MEVKISNKKYLKVDFDSNREMNAFGLYFTREKRTEKFKKYKSKGTKFYTGTFQVRKQLWEELQKFCSVNNFDFRFPEMDKMFRNDITKEEVIEFCKSQIKGTIYEDYDMEDTYESVFMALSNKYFKMDLSVSYGKSIFLYLYSTFLILRKKAKKVCINTSKPDLAIQLMGDFAEVNKRNFPFSVWRSGIKIKDAPVVITSFKFLANVKSEILDEFDVLVHDECHRTSAPTCETIFNKFGNMESSGGVSGSILEDGSAEDFMVKSNTGNTIKKVSKRDIISAGRATDGIIQAITLSYLSLQERQVLVEDRYNKKIDKLISLSREQDKILTNDWRLKTLVKLSYLAYKKSGNGIVFFKTASYGTKFIELMKKLTPETKFFYIDENTTIIQRKTFQDYMEQNNDAILVGTYDTIATGMSVKKLYWGIALEPVKSFFTVEQMLGRFMRLHSTKDKFIWYDIIDDFRIVQNDENGVRRTIKNYMYSWFESRSEIYKNNTFVIKNQTIEQKEEDKSKKYNPKSLL